MFAPPGKNTDLFLGGKQAKSVGKLRRAMWRQNATRRNVKIRDVQGSFHTEKTDGECVRSVNCKNHTIVSHVMEQRKPSNQF